MQIVSAEPNLLRGENPDEGGKEHDGRNTSGSGPGAGSVLGSPRCFPWLEIHYLPVVESFCARTFFGAYSDGERRHLLIAGEPSVARGYYNENLRGARRGNVSRVLENFLLQHPGQSHIAKVRHSFRSRTLLSVDVSRICGTYGCCRATA